MLTRNLKSLLIFLAILAVVIFIILARPKTDPDNLTGNIFGNSATEKTGANQDVPMADNGEPIQIAYTDDNGGENLIIATDKETYSGFSNSDVHISLKNADSVDHNGKLIFYFPEKDDTVIKSPASVRKVWVYQADSMGSPQAGKWLPLEILTSVDTNDPALRDSLAKQKGIPENMAFRGAANFSAKSGETIYFKAEINYPPGGVGEFFIEGVADHGGYGLLDPWYSSTYAYRRPLIINHNKVSTVSKTTLSNFPVLVNITNSDLKASASGGYVQRVTGNDILFTDSTGSTKLAYELESYTGTTGNVVAWVKVASLSPSFDTTMYMYYNNATATDQSAATSVWDTNYKGVWHLPNGTTLTALDSTSNDKDGTPGAGTTAIAGQIDGGANVHASDAPISTPAQTGTFGSGTLSAWIKLTSFDNYAGVVFTRPSNNRNMGILLHDSGNIGFDLYGTWDNNTGLTPNLNEWIYVVLTFECLVDVDEYLGQGGTVSSYHSSLYIPDLTSDNPLWIGLDGGYASRFLHGSIDEVRFSSIKRSADWIKTEYNNQSDPSTFVGMNAPQTPTRTAPSINIKGGVKIRGGVKFH